MVIKYYVQKSKLNLKLDQRVADVCNNNNNNKKNQ